MPHSSSGRFKHLTGNRKQLLPAKFSNSNRWSHTVPVPRSRRGAGKQAYVEERLLDPSGCWRFLGSSAELSGSPPRRGRPQPGLKDSCHFLGQLPMFRAFTYYCVSMYTYIHVYIYIYTHTYVYIYTNMCTYIHMYIYTYTYTNTHMDGCMHACMDGWLDGWMYG